MSKPSGGQRWSKYSPEFKRAAVDRMVGGESPTAIARELGIRCKFLYAWKAAGKGSQGVPQVPEKADKDPQEHEVARLRRRISELERLTGRQTAELDFFAAALRSVKETRRKSGADSGEELRTDSRAGSCARPSQYRKDVRVRQSEPRRLLPELARTPAEGSGNGSA